MQDSLDKMWIDDWDVVMAAVQKNGCSLKNISERLKNDKEIILAAIKQESRAYQYIPINLQNDKEFIKDLLKVNPYVFTILPSQLKEDKDMAIIALDNSCKNEICSGAYLYRQMPESLKSDLEIIELSLKSDPMTVLQLDQTCRGNTTLIHELVKRDGMIIQYASEDIRDSESIATTALENNPNSFRFLSDRLKNFRAFAILAIEKDGKNYLQVSDTLKNDKEIALLAVQKHGRNLRDLPEELRKEKQIILEAFKENSSSIAFSLNTDLDSDQKIFQIYGNDFICLCGSNRKLKTKLNAIQNINYLPTIKQIENGLKDINYKVRQIYQLRKDEWLAKIEEDKLRDNLLQEKKL